MSARLLPHDRRAGDGPPRFARVFGRQPHTAGPQEADLPAAVRVRPTLLDALEAGIPATVEAVEYDPQRLV
ncbi:MAG TPA: hypothetical protein PKG77_02680 [Phycisphaerae bacterium]|nr:hypothetical protein [Phycisphaerae bacterium]HQL72551.1 hypothetical protein [Phycisphaerae bacterium]